MSSVEARGRGRPREFDVEQALEKAIDVFRQRGYDGTSMTDLLDGMALSRGSLYKAFKDKRSVFLAAYDRYTSINQERLQQAIEQADSGRARVLAVLNTYAVRASDENGRMGCLVVATAINLTTVDPEIASRVSASVDRLKKLLMRLLTEGKADGSVNAHIDERATAELILCLVQGMRILGKTSPHRAVMNRVVAEAMKLLD